MSALQPVQRGTKPWKTRFGIDTYACGLCQTGIPCTSHIPNPEE